MKALVCRKPGVMEYKEVAASVVQPGHAIIQIKRVGICGTDLHAYNGTQPYFNYPRILGHELSGDVIEAGGTEEFVPGERVTIIPYFNCGKCVACRNQLPNCCVHLQVLGVHIDGGMQETVVVPSDALVKSNGLGYDELALVEPLSIGAHGVRRAGIRPDEFVLVIGAGPIGIGAMQMAAIAGAKVIALDVNASRLLFCQEKLSVNFVLNASNDNVLQQLMEITSGDLPTVVMDATGNQQAINNALPYLAHGGRFVLIGLQKEPISFSHPEFHKREATLMSSRNATRRDFEYVIRSMKDGRIDPSAYITQKMPFREAKEAFETWLFDQAMVIKAMVEIV
jgi:2-desacetyl-2-hydroxyethyl bacteriochlorophyllide A dehydrogenase